MSMRHRVIVCGSVASLGIIAQPATAAPQHCAKAGSKTIAANVAARVYRRGPVLYGCLRSTGRTARLATNYDDGYVTSGAWSLVRVDGRFVAFRFVAVDSSCKANCPPGYSPETSSVKAVDLRTGRGVHSARAKGSPFTALAVTTTGALAFVQDRALLALDATGRRVLDAGPVPPRSLRARRHRVLWTSASGSSRAATLR